MSEKENDEFLIDIERTGDETKIRISNVRRTEFDRAYKLASQLNQRAKELDAEIEEQQKLESIKAQVDHLWTKDGSIWKLSESVSDASFRIALSLLRTHPKCRKQVDVIKETEIAQMTASDNLSGKVKSTNQYFERCGKGYRLSSTGLKWVFDKVIPSLSSISKKKQ
jgi:hypothetical protein